MAFIANKCPLTIWGRNNSNIQQVHIELLLFPQYRYPYLTFSSLTDNFEQVFLTSPARQQEQSCTASPEDLMSNLLLLLIIRESRSTLAPSPLFCKIIEASLNLLQLDITVWLKCVTFIL